MLRHLTLAAAAMFLAAPAMADETCVGDGIEAQCDIFMDEYRADETPVGTANVWSTEPFVMQYFWLLDSGRPLSSTQDSDVLYWDGESAMIVPDEAGPQVKIADW